MSKMIYGVHDRPPAKQVALFAAQQMLSIIAATIAVPAIVGHGLDSSAALFGAGIGTLTYLVCTKFESPVMLSSSFSFVGAMVAAYAGSVSLSLGAFGLILGSFFAGMVYVILSFAVKHIGTSWLDKIMPPVVVGATVTLIGLSLSSSAVNNLMQNASNAGSGFLMNARTCLGLLCGIATLLIIVITNIYSTSVLRMIPFILGIGGGYALALGFSLIGLATGNKDFLLIDFGAFTHFHWIPDFVFLKVSREPFDYGEMNNMGTYVIHIALAYIPLAFVSFAEHIADHKNLSSVIGADLLKNPGLDHTLLGDGLGSVIGSLFGGCANTTYGESISCAGISKNASVVTTVCTSCIAIVLSFIAPVTTLLASIPSSVMGGLCFATCGFICVSGLKMLQQTDLDDMRNLFVVGVILVAGVGSMALDFHGFTLSAISVALLMGIVINQICNFGRARDEKLKKLRSKRVSGLERSYRYIRLEGEWHRDVFELCHMLIDTSRMAAEDAELFLEVEAFFNEKTPTPKALEGASVYYKMDNAGELYRWMKPVLWLLDTYGVQYHVECCNDPGNVVYENEYMVLVK